MDAAGQARALALRLRAHDAEITAGFSSITKLTQVLCTVFNAAAFAVPLLVALFDPYRREVVATERGTEIVGKGDQVGIGERVINRDPGHGPDCVGQRIH